MKNFINNYFKLKESNTSISIELLAGFTTFISMSTIIFLNPTVLSEAGMDKYALITGTCLASAFASLLMGLYANYPIGLASTMGVNSFFALVVVNQMGLTWQQGLTAVFIVGILFVIITATKIRELIMYSIPYTINMSITVGIGIFLITIGLQQAEIILTDYSTFFKFGELSTPSSILVLFGFILILTFSYYKIKGAILLSIIAVTIASIPLGVTTAPTSFISTPPSIAPIFFKFDFSEFFNLNFIMAVVTLLFLAIFDTVGTLIAIATRANLLDKNGNMVRSRKAFMSDAIGSVGGAIFGVSTVGSYLESITGIESGGRTGLTAVFIALFFILAMFFSPLIAIVPAAAIAPALIFIGLLMMTLIKNINYKDITELVPSLLGIIMIPLSGDIAVGIEYAILSYLILKLLTGQFKKISNTIYVLSAIFIIKRIFEFFNF